MPLKPNPAPRDFYETDPVTLAKRLIGARLVRTLEDGTCLAGTIVETEAYLGVEDKAAHSVGGRRTARTEAMFARAGTSYVFMTYGMHHCFNVVCGGVDVPVAVLVRALEPVEGEEEMFVRRGPAARKATDLCSGPAKLCQALAIDRRLNGVDLVGDPGVCIELGGQVGDGVLRGVGRIAESELANTPRIGVDYAQEWAAAPLRWFLRKSQHVSGSRAEETRPLPVAKVMDSIGRAVVSGAGAMGERTP